MSGFTERYMNYYKMYAELETAQIRAYEAEHGEGSWADYDPTEY